MARRLTAFIDPPASDNPDAWSDYLSGLRKLSAEGCDVASEIQNAELWIAALSGDPLPDQDAASAAQIRDILSKLNGSENS